MNFESKYIAVQDKVSINNLLRKNGTDSLIEEIVKGLSSERKIISSKFFYDDKGSDLFEEITRLPEYYPTRTEISIIQDNRKDILEYYGSNDIIELGSGDCSKISLLFESMDASSRSGMRYIPVDVSSSAIHSSSDELVRRFPELSVEGYVLDFTADIGALPRDEPALICFFGSTIGNFNPKEAVNLLFGISGMMLENDTLLVGFDMLKPDKLLNDAYNDRQGITADFNLNVLNVVNGIIESDFNSEDFEHYAYFNKNHSRIEMHLRAKRDMRVSSRHFNSPLALSKGSMIHTENSYKFSDSDINKLAESAGLRIQASYTDSSNLFSLVAFKKD